MSDNFVRSTNLYNLRLMVNTLYGVHNQNAAAHIQSGDVVLINNAISRVLDDFPIFALGWHTLTTVANQRAYSPPPLCETRRLLDVRWKQGNTTNPQTGLLLKSQAWFDKHRPSWVWTTVYGNPTLVVYDATKNQINLDPVPSTASWTMEIWYERRGCMFSTSYDADGVLTTPTLINAGGGVYTMAAGNSAPNGAYASSSVVTFTYPHPVSIVSSVAPNTAITWTITGTDQDGNAATENISHGTSSTTVHGVSRWRTITNIAWTPLTAFSSATEPTCTVGDFDQTAAASTHYCDVPDQYIHRLLSPAINVQFAQNERDAEGYQLFETMYQTAKQECGASLKPIIDIYARGGMDGNIHRQKSGAWSPL